VLKLWGRNSLITILQLLPERLWERTALASETPVQLRSLTPGVPNSKLIVETWDEETWEDFAENQENQTKNSISVPIITLEPEPLRTWSRLIAGNGNLGTAGFRFSPSISSSEVQQNETITSQTTSQLSAKALVSRFRATASPLARRLVKNFYRNLDLDENKTEEDRRLIMRLQPLYQQDQELAKQQGREEEGQNLVIRQLNRRFGEIDSSLIERVRGLSIEQLEALAEALLDFTAITDFESWLNQQR
jgi:Domain of unknown function (DUF4351)